MLLGPLSTASAGSPNAGRRKVGILPEHGMQQPPTAAAYVKVVVEGGQRSPSRLRYSYSSTDSPRPGASSARLPDFIQVERMPAGTAVVSPGLVTPNSGSRACAASADV